jgi:hypothetical protein
MIDDSVGIEVLDRHALTERIEGACRVAQLMEEAINSLQARSTDESILPLLADAAYALRRDLHNLATKLQDDAVKLRD